MSPEIALHDSVFRAYFWIVMISLAVAGSVLGFLRFVLKKKTVDGQEVLVVDSHRWYLLHHCFPRKDSNDRGRHVAFDLRF